MNKILQLLIDDYRTHKPSAEYLLMLDKFCLVEEKFLALLDEKQRKAYMDLQFTGGELDILSEREFAEYLFASVRKYL